MPLCFKDFFLEDIKIIFFHFCKWSQPFSHQLSPLLQLYLLLVRQALHFHLKTSIEESFWGPAAVIYGQGGTGLQGTTTEEQKSEMRWKIYMLPQLSLSWTALAGRMLLSIRMVARLEGGMWGGTWRFLWSEVLSRSHPLSQVDVVLHSHVAVKQLP